MHVALGLRIDPMMYSEGSLYKRKCVDGVSGAAVLNIRQWTTSR
jgi:hypothetical protein